MGRIGKERPSLGRMFSKQLWPTVTVTVTVKGNYNKKGLSIRSGDGLITALRNAGFSTPTTQFVCWYMGFPSDWLSSGSSATPVCRRKRAELSKSSRAARKKAKAQHE